MGADVAAQLPTFAILGAMRSGTTALFDRLAAVDGVVLSDPKEPHHFSQELYDRAAGPGDAWVASQVVRDRDAYRALFAGPPGSPRGEASATTLHHEEACARMAAAVPGIRVVVLLRDPVERAHSAYWQLRGQGREPLPTFEAALEAEPSRVARGWGPMWHYLGASRYAVQLERLAAFDPEQVLVLGSIEARSPEGFSRICAHVGVAVAPPTASTTRTNAAGRPRSALLNRVLHPAPGVRRLLGAVAPPPVRAAVRAARARNLAGYPPLAPATHADLEAELAPDVRAARRWLGDHPAW